MYNLDRILLEPLLDFCEIKEDLPADPCMRDLLCLNELINKALG